jgi:hypothetical protein
MACSHFHSVSCPELPIDDRNIALFARKDLPGTLIGRFDPKNVLEVSLSRQGHSLTTRRLAPKRFWLKSSLTLFPISSSAFDAYRNTFNPPRRLVDKSGAPANFYRRTAKDSIVLDHCDCYQLWNSTSQFLLCLLNGIDVGQVYSAVLVLVTQMLSLRRSLKMDQTLTATHDTSAAWAGLGSATVLAWNQKAVPASIVGVFLVFLYLGSISVLHITIPALFSIQAFTTSRSVPAITQSLPSFNFSGFNLSNEADRWGAW